jgi:hypothetical protein
MLRKILPPVAVAAGAFFLLSNDPAAAEDIDGTDGDDILNGNDGESDDIEGNDGNDTVNGGDETDTVPGDQDFDGDEIDGGFGDDTLNGEGGDDLIAGDDNHCHFGDTEDVGCGGNDTINGGDGDDILVGDDNTCHAGEPAGIPGDCAGNDTIDGGAGNDVIVGDGNGFDNSGCEYFEEEGGDCAGNDTIQGGAGDDEIAGDGNFCFESDNLARAIAQDATAAAPVGYSCGGDDTIDGGEGDDEILGDDNFCGAEGSFGPDDACAGDDTINGGAGDDYIEGDGVFCFIFDPDEGASFVGCAGDDIIDGADGDDVIFGDTSSFELIGGGEGFCDIFFPFPNGPNGEAVASVIDDPTEFELCLIGGNDTITGGAGSDAIFGGNGNDLAGGGADIDIVLGDLGILFLQAFESEEFETVEEFVTFLAEELGSIDDAEFLFGLLNFYFFDINFGGGDDEVTGDAGVDVVMGEGGHDAVCGDLSDVLVTGGGGSDVPCPVVEGTFDATSGSVTINLGTGIRELDDEFLEVDENGVANPWQLVVIVAPTKGTLTFNGTNVTYVANPGATGTDFFEYAIRRRVVACPGEITVVLGEGSETFDLCEPGEAFPVALVEVGGVDFVQSGSKRITLTLQTPPPPPPPPPQPPAVGAQTAALPVTGGNDLGLALAGLGLVALGAAVTAESKRRRHLLEVRA